MPVSIPAEEEVIIGAPLQAVFPPTLPDRVSTIRFERITGEDGLSQNSVLAILQDRRGFMWFGTEGGLNKYDGYQFTVYKHDSDDPLTLSDDFVSAIYEDRSGELWVGTRNGLNRFDRATGTFVRYQHDPSDPQGLGGVWVVAIYEDGEGMLWVGTEDGGLDRLDRDTDTFTHHRHDADDPKTLVDNTVTVIYEDRSGALWVGTESGLDRFDRATGTFIHYQNIPGDPQSLGGSKVSAIFEDRQGALWIGTEDGGLDQFDRSSQTFTRYQHDPDNPHSLSHDRVRAVFEDSTRRLWIGTQNGLDLFDRERNQFVHYRHSANDLHSLSSNAIWSIYEDRTGVLWFGTYGGGLSKYNRTTDQFTLYQHNPDLPNSLSDDMVWSIYEDRSGLLWIGTLNEGLDKLDRESGTFTVYQHDAKDSTSISSDDVRTILEDREYVLWVGTSGGLDQFDPQTETFIHYRHDPDDPNSLSDDRVIVLYEDSFGNLWVGTRNEGLNRFDRETETFVRYQHDPDDPFSLSDDRVWALYEDSTGVLWVGTLGGISVLDVATGRFTRYVHDPDDLQSLGNDQAFSFYEDPTGAVWIGTWGSGLDRFDRATQTFAHYTEKDGLPDNVIYGIEVDSEGFLWMSTNKGLSKFDPRAETFQNYDVSDGLQNNEFNVGAHFTSDSGEMFFGGIQGFNTFYPERVTGNPHVPPIVVTTFSKFNEAVRADLSPNEHIQLSYKDNFISFEFAALDYTAPEKNQYVYMLEGQDQDWVDAGTRRHVDYTNLRGGDYVFRVKGSNNDGVWNEEGIAVFLTVTPPVWETWWFRGIALVVLVAGLIGGYRLRIRSIEAQSRELERQVEQRTAELRQEMEHRKQAEKALAQRAAEAAVAAERSRLARDLHDAVTQTLFSASLIAEVLPRIWERNPDEGWRRLEEVRELTRGALAEMRMLLWELRPSYLVEAELGDLLRQLAEATTGRARVPVTVEVEGEYSQMPPDMKVALYRIAQEALNNVAKPAWGGCRLIVDRLRPEGPEGLFFDPDPVEGWTGSVFGTPTDAQFDDYFVRSGNIPMRYGIESADAAISAQLESLNDAAAIIRVWGQVMCPVIDFQGSQIQVNRIEIVMEVSAEAGYEGWKPYLNEKFGYALWYPGECTVMGNNFDESVQFAAREWPVLTVSHYDSDFFHPPAEADLEQWIADHVPSYDEMDTEVEIAGLPAVHLTTHEGQGAYGYDDYYFVRGDQLFQIMILHTGGQQDWELYNKFLQSFTFP